MSTLAATEPTSLRRAALVAGLGLLLMAVLAGLANFAVLDRLVLEGDASGTASGIRNALGIFRLSIVALFGVAVLDVVVALALWAFFDDVHRAAAVIAAACRVLYAAIFAVAISHLVPSAELLSGRQVDSAVAAEVLAEIQQFDNIWSIGLGLFGIHLLLIGWLALVSGLVPRHIGVLVAIAGAGYIVDSLGILLLSTYAFEVASITFVGEVVLMVWLLIFAARRPRSLDDHRPAGAIDLTTTGSSDSGSRS